MKYLFIILFFVSCTDNPTPGGSPIDTTTQTKPDSLPLEPSEKGAQPKAFFAFDYGYLQPVTGLTTEGDNYEVLQNLINTVKGRIILPAGTFFCSKTLTWNDKTVTLEGQGVGKTILTFKGTTGFKITRTHSVPRSKISGLSIISYGQTPGTHGIDIGSITDLQDIYIKDFGGDGVHYYGNIGVGFDVSGCVAINIEAAECGGNGIYIEGGDANALFFYGCNTRDNGGAGFQDNGFLGSSFFGCMGHNNAKGNFGVGDNNNSRAVISGCYSEGASPLSQIASYTTVIGGTWGSGFKVNASGFERHGNYLPLEGNQ